MEIRRYEKQDEQALMVLLEAQGEEWSCYSAPEFSAQYRRVLATSITYVACQDGAICGYSRSLNDGDFYIYVCDLLVDPRFRGQDLGRQLLERACADYPCQTVYVMSDVDAYYTKLGYPKEGSIFHVQPK